MIQIQAPFLLHFISDGEIACLLTGDIYNI